MKLLEKGLQHFRQATHKVGTYLNVELKKQRFGHDIALDFSSH